MKLRKLVIGLSLAVGLAATAAAQTVEETGSSYLTSFPVKLLASGDMMDI